MWRFDGNGRFPKIQPPTVWQADQHVVWKTEVEVGGYSSPIVVRDKVFLTEEMGSLVCLNLADGKPLWRKDLFSPTSTDIPADISPLLMRGCGRDSKQSTPTPASNGELVFYINAMGLSACYDLQGNQKWIRIIETAEDEEYFSSSPLFVGDKIILSWGGLLAVNAKDGKTLWKSVDARPTHGTPTIARIGGEEVIITPAGDIVRLSNGERLCSGLFESVYTTPLVENNILYVIDTESKALELPSKAEVGMQPKELWTTELDGVFMASPVFEDGLLYTIENQKCLLSIIEANTGKVLTTSRYIDDFTKAEKTVSGLKIAGLAPAHFAYASPVASGKHVYFFDDAGNTAVLKIGREYQPVRVNQLGDALIGTPFFIGDKMIVRGNKTVYCIGEKR